MEVDLAYLYESDGDRGRGREGEAAVVVAGGGVFCASEVDKSIPGSMGSPIDFLWR